MTVLADLDTGRDNNFNLIRMAAAVAVLVSHAWPAALGSSVPEPLDELMGQSIGSLAVLIFFAISGYFISASLERSRSRGRFVMARVRRLYPALVVSILFVALVIGPLVTTLPLAEYLAHPDLWRFVLLDSSAVMTAYHLPGVFETNPLPVAATSIWTLRYEIACYAGLFLMGVTGMTRRRGLMAVVFGLFVALYLAQDIAPPESLPRPIVAFHNLGLPFAIGMAFHIWRDRLPISLPVAVALAVVAILLRETPLYRLMLAITLAYATFCLAFIPGTPLQLYRRLGDYSYGTYLYAWPLQSLVVWLWGPMTPWTNIALSLPPTLLIAVLSWRWVERPALQGASWRGSAGKPSMPLGPR